MKIELIGKLNTIYEEIAAEYEALDKKNGFKRWFSFLWKNLKRLFRRKRR